MLDAIIDKCEKILFVRNAYRRYRSYKIYIDKLIKLFKLFLRYLIINLSYFYFLVAVINKVLCIFNKWNFQYFEVFLE